ncbi:MAG: pirin family protein [Desulfuromonadales bacterium]|nr:pirin family protein [Desulfuromonadales bacterium]
MITLCPSAERGHFRSEWLDSRHTFSFDTYYDPQQMGFRALRVINEDWVQPGHGFPLHRHQDMEILTFVIEGELRHQDDQGNSGVIGPCQLQRMTAGTGIRHSEANPSQEQVVHLLQIWIHPERTGLTPGYEQKSFPGDAHRGLRLLASPDGRDGSALIHRDVRLYAGTLEAGAILEQPLAPGRHAWLQMLGGMLTLAGHRLQTGDGAAVSDETMLRLQARENASFLLFDLD